MKRLLLLLLALAALSQLTGCIFYSTGSTEVGVRTKKMALIGDKGVENRTYAPGSTYIFLPFVNDWNTLDTKLQNVEMTMDVTSGERRSKDDLVFKTVDGNDISLDVIIAYRIDPEKAPYIIQNVARSDQELREKIVRTISRSVPRDIFGELKTEEFYVADMRQAKAEKVRDILQQVFVHYGVIVERVLPKDYRFNPAYQQAIEAKKIADQQTEKNKAATRAAVEEYRKKLEDARGEVNKMVAEADGWYEKAKIDADAYLERQKRIAEAIEVEGKAEAEGIAKMNAALSGGGGETMVKLKIAEALAGKRIMLIPASEGGLNLKTTDVNGLLQLQGLRSMTRQQHQQQTQQTQQTNQPQQRPAPKEQSR